MSDKKELLYTDAVTAAYLEEQPKRTIAASYVIGAMTIGLILWAMFAEIDEFTRATGKVVPSQDVQVIQNLEGGIVEEIFAREGQLVNRDEAIIRLDDTRFASSANEASIEIKYLVEKRARLTAEANGENYTPIDPQYAQNELKLFQTRAASLNNDKTIVNERIEQREIRLADVVNQKTSSRAQFALLEKEYNLTKPLIAEGAVSEVEVLRLERSVEEMRQRARSLDAEAGALRSEIEELESTLALSDTNFQAAAQEERNEIVARIDMLQQSAQRVDDQLDRTIVRSPVKGTVKVMHVSTIGGVVQPGMNLVEIVPFEDQLMVEVKVRPMDIAFIHPDQQASVRITAYDFSIHGDLKGKVVNISPDSIVDEQGESYYLVKILTDDPSLQTSFKDLPIIPGMTVDAGILTGKKTVLDYLLKPIIKTADNAMRER